MESKVIETELNKITVENGGKISLYVLITT